MIGLPRTTLRLSKCQKPATLVRHQWIDYIETWSTAAETVIIIAVVTVRSIVIFAVAAIVEAAVTATVEADVIFSKVQSFASK